METILAWHFLEQDHILNHKDGRKAVEGETLSCEGAIKLYSNGMHASIKIIDALGYAKSSELSLVEISGDIEIGDDKIAGRSRKVLEIHNVDNVLFEFACSEAELALDAVKKEGGVVHEDSYAAINASKDYRKGLISKEELAAAYAAARAATCAAAWSAARSAAWSAAESAAWSAARSEQNKRLTKELSKIFSDTPEIN